MNRNVQKYALPKEENPGRLSGGTGICTESPYWTDPERLRKLEGLIGSTKRWMAANRALRARCARSDDFHDLTPVSPEMELPDQQATHENEQKVPEMGLVLGANPPKPHLKLDAKLEATNRAIQAPH